MEASLMESRGVAREPDWLTGNLEGYPAAPVIPLSAASEKTGEQEVVLPLQQSDLLKPLLMDIARHGLSYAYDKFSGEEPAVSGSGVKQTERPRDVIVIGAGLAGMAAAYELKRVGHNVTILEAQDRVGGRIRTYDEDDGFAEGLHVEAGAMRLPGRPGEDEEKTHFLTTFYTEELFKLRVVDFVNSNDNAFLKFYNKPLIQRKDWDNATFSELWPGWDRTIRLTGAKSKYNIDDIDTYYELTTNIVVDQLRVLLADAISSIERATIWSEWVDTWSHFPVDGFLHSTKEAVMYQIPAKFQIGLDKLGELLPWPEAAVTAYAVFSYLPAMDTSLVEFLRETMGHWWSPNMHTIKGGMSKFTKAFKRELKGHFKMRFTVTEIVYESPSDDLQKKVRVKGFHERKNGMKVTETIEGHAVIVTAPINILRQLKFSTVTDSTQQQSPHKSTSPMPIKFYKAIEDIWYGPSSKIMLQCKTRFWETEHQIQGGFTKTNLPIGQIHYPSNPGFNTIPRKINGGILLVYTWKSEALMFGSLPPELAVAEAVEQIAEIHPQILTEFEHGAIKSWYNDPAQQGAYALLKPRQEHNVRWLMYPWKNIYFAGEAISFANGWIQGALESGLRAAYQFYARNEHSVGN